ncbi:hypothetical protein G3570_13195 [Balneolaceae bacterium YR4-1]|uniref:Uncharacterized protein n=1 Tax=Halalkalibaculum roseum TaxID=2709311 RepID=A0A6M1SZ32_9BACT|nr:hypothetical protein [Halalkalibaculum roseum]
MSSELLPSGAPEAEKRGERVLKQSIILTLPFPHSAALLRNEWVDLCYMDEELEAKYAE